MHVSPSFSGGLGHGLHIKKAGQKIPQEAVFDLKTRAGWRKGLNVLEDELPRYWVAQIPNFILARYDSGVFNNINVQYIWDDVKKWQRENQKDIKCLSWLLCTIIAIAKARKDGKLEVRCKSLEALELREQDTNEHNVLPLELKLQWVEDKETGSTKDKQSKSDDKWTAGVALPASGSNLSNYGRGFSFDSDEESEKDYTACSADSCGYCGHCSY